MLQEGAWVAAAQVVAALAKLVGLSVLTDLVSPEVYGQVALLLGISVLGTGFLFAPFFQAALRFYPEAAKDARINMLRRVAIGALWRGGLVAGALFVAGAGIWSRRTGDVTGPLARTALLAVVLFGELVRTFETSLLSAARRQAVWGAWTAIDACARPLAAVVAIHLFGPTVEAVLLGYGVAGIAINLAFARATVRGSYEEDESTSDPWQVTMRREFLRYALPLAPLALLGWVMNLSDRYILGATGGAAAVGEYAAIYGLGSMPFLVWSGIGLTTFRPILFDAVAQGDRRKERMTIAAWLLMTVPASLLGVLVMGAFASRITSLALGEAFWGGAPLLPWIAAAYAVQGTQVVFETMIYAQRRTKRVTLLHASGAVIALLLYALLIPGMGAKGAAIATFAAFLVSCSIGFFLAESPRRLFPGATTAA